MASYEVLILPSAAREIAALPLEARRRVIGKIRALATDPRPAGAIHLRGSDHLRLRVGMYRIVYRIEDRKLIVLIVRVGHRGDVSR